jgi:hypothetical protein
MGGIIMAKITLPCDVAITRFYRTYVEVDEDATAPEVFQKVRAEILEQQDDALTPDPDLDIEDHDITYIGPDWGGSWYTDNGDE